MDRYVIVRNLAAAPTAGPFAPSTFGQRVAAAPIPPELRVEVQDLSNKDVRDAYHDPEVQAIAPVIPTMLIRPFAADAGAAVNDAWGIDAIGATDSSRTGEGVTVAVLDTGIDKTHPAFEGVDIVEQDFTGTGNGDQQGHGTHCAGTIFGRDVNGVRIGVAHGVGRALIGKVLDKDGGGTSDMIFDGILWAIRQRAHVVSMSLGFDFPGSVQRRISAGWPADLATSVALQAFQANLRCFDRLVGMVKDMAAFGEGTVVVAAAGNESRREANQRFQIAASLPAAAEGVISVGALEQAAGGLGVASFSNTFPEISAPGVRILSAKLGGGLVALSGTSMACPHVAGTACLWWEELQKSSTVVPKANLVVAKMLAAARTGVFASGMDPSDRGAGIITAPL
jgi:subtilisin family serine protease